MKNEVELYKRELGDHLGGIEYRLRHFPEDKLDWLIAPPAPTPRQVVHHALEWLICDRQHIEEPDTSKHDRIPELPRDKIELADALHAERERWLFLLDSLTPEKLAEPRHQFAYTEYQSTVRGFIGHILQQCIYKSGQLSLLYFALGLDGDAPYDAPFPNTFYTECYGEKEAT